jgi:hypothetical protein
MKLNLNKYLILAFILGCMSFVSQNSMAASDNVALSQDWHVALPAELPEPQQALASLDQ